MAVLDLKTKLAILSDAAKYDASCASSGGAKRDSLGGRGVGSVDGGMGICHAYAPDGRCISLLKLLHLLDPLHGGRQPRLEYGLGIHRVEARPQPLLDLAQHAILHRLEVGQPEEGARLLGRAGHFDVYFHSDPPLPPDPSML